MANRAMFSSVWSHVDNVQHCAETLRGTWGQTVMWWLYSRTNTEDVCRRKTFVFFYSCTFSLILCLMNEKENVYNIINF